MILIEVRSKSPLVDGDVEEFVKDRMTFALDRFRQLRRIQIFVEDVNGPKGGTDKRARIVADFGFATVLARETHTTWQGAVSRAIHRIARSAARRLQRMNRTPVHRRRRASAMMAQRGRSASGS